jgi:hypothetical protein
MWSMVITHPYIRLCFWHPEWPPGAINVFDNLHKTIGKTAVQNALDNLAAKEQINMKAYGACIALHTGAETLLKRLAPTVRGRQVQGLLGEASWRFGPRDACSSV